MPVKGAVAAVIASAVRRGSAVGKSPWVLAAAIACGRTRPGNCMRPTLAGANANRAARPYPMKTRYLARHGDAWESHIKVNGDSSIFSAAC
jgi:hypothetical protein